MPTHESTAEAAPDTPPPTAPARGPGLSELVRRARRLLRFRWGLFGGVPSEDELMFSIFALRREIACARQSRHTDTWARLEEFLGELASAPGAARHPFKLSSVDYGRLSRQEVFAGGSLGLRADPPEGQFLYRLCSLESLNEFLKWKYEEVDKDRFERLEGDRDHAGPWLPLADYAEPGELKGPLGFTWWTSFQGLPEDVVTGAKRLGLLITGEYKLVLRCRSSYVRGRGLARVPSVIDAFANAIFHPTHDDHSPRNGVAISVERPRAFVEGADEFVVAGIPVEEIDLIPVHVTDEMRRACLFRREGIHCWRWLRSYYRGMLRA